MDCLQVDERAAFPRLATSRVLKPLDDAPVWSVTCFFIKRGFRRQGISARMLHAACANVKARGGVVLEGYPIDTLREHHPALYAWIRSSLPRCGLRGGRPSFRNPPDHAQGTGVNAAARRLWPALLCRVAQLASLLARQMHAKVHTLFEWIKGPHWANGICLRTWRY